MQDGYSFKDILDKFDKKVEDMASTVNELKVAVALLTNLAERVETLETRVTKNSWFITYVTGAWAVVAGIIALVGRDILFKLFH